MVGRKNQGVGQVFSMFDKTAAGVAPDKRGAGGDNGGLLKVTDRDAGRFPSIHAQNRGVDMAEKGLINSHVFIGGGFCIEKEATAHALRLRGR